MTLNAHAKDNHDVRAIIETSDDWKNGKTSTIKQRNDWFTPNNSTKKIKNVGSGHVKNYEPLRQPIMTRQDFPFSSISESSKNINGHPNYIGSQNNKLEQTCLNKIKKINHHDGANNNDETIEEIIIRENDSDSSNSSNSNKKSCNILRNFKSIPIKNNRVEHLKTVSARRKNNYAGISKKNMKIKKNSLQTNNEKRTDIKNDTSDSNCNRKNRKRICVDKMRDINSKVKRTIISENDGKNVNDDGCNINKSCIIDAGTCIKDDKKVNNGVDKDNYKDFISAMKINFRKIMNVNGKYNNSILENGISSNNSYIVKNSNILIVDQKELKNLILYMLYTQFYSSPYFQCEVKLFKLRLFMWKKKFKDLKKIWNQLCCDIEKLHNDTIQQSRQLSSEFSYSRIINLNTSCENTDAMKNIVSNVLKTSPTSTLKTPSLTVTVLLSRSTNPPNVVLKWDLKTNVCNSRINGNIIEYEIAIIAFFNDQMVSDSLETIGVVKALQLPMSCTTQSLNCCFNCNGNWYQFGNINIAISFIKPCISTDCGVLHGLGNSPFLYLTISYYFRRNKCSTLEEWYNLSFCNQIQR